MTGPEGERRSTPSLIGWLVLSWVALYALSLWLSGAVTQPGSPVWAWGAPSPQVLVRLGAEVPAEVELGAWQQLVTHAFLHGFLLHLVLNAWIFVGAGRLLESVAGSARLWIVFVVSAVAGGVAHLLWGQGAVAVGASGGIFGVVGAVGAWSLFSPHPAAPGVRRSILFFLVLSLLISLLPGVGLAAHLGGLAAGAVVMLLLGPRRAQRPAGRPLRTLAWLLLGVVLAAAGVQAFGGATIDREATRALLADLDAMERQAEALYERPDRATPGARSDLARRLEALRRAPVVENLPGRDALRAWLDAWQPVADGNVPDPFAFDEALASARAAWKPQEARLRRAAGLP
ncbi:MAG: rhomboid family intramembrane serine protease [Planctomycetota bacterium]